MRSFKVLAVGLSAFAAFTFAACDEQPTEPEAQADFAKKSPVENNGAPSGKHYTLNIIGTSDKNPEMKGNKGHRIFMDLWSRGNPGKILLCESGVVGGCAPNDDYVVLDANGTDGEAKFALPNPDPDCDGTTDYSVYVRALGKPGHYSVMQTCYYDSVTGETWCAVNRTGYVEPITIGRTNGGKSVFRNESKNLLYVDYCVTYNVTTSTCDEWAVSPLFGDDGASYWWEYDNYGQRVAQLRFYPESTNAWPQSDMYCPSD